jgi:FG-GAP-like repeat/IPT/TIG domain
LNYRLFFTTSLLKVQIMIRHILSVCKILFVFLLCIAAKAAAQPTIVSFTPVSAAAGTSVTITGTNFNAVAANNIVKFGVKNAIVVSGNTTSLTVTAPAGATYQPVSVFDNATGLMAYASGAFITTFTNPFGTGIPANFYNAKIDYTTGVNPRSIVMEDVNGDGKPDMLVANDGANSLSVLLNTTAAPGAIPGFTAKFDFTTGVNPKCIATGDLNGDGKPDLVVANSGAATVSVFLNTTANGAATPSFTAKSDFTTGTTPVSVAIADANGDGKPDIVVANSGAASVSVLRNTTATGAGVPSFAPKSDFTTGTTPVSVVIGDANGDSQPDMMVANSGAASVSIFRNTTPAGGAIFTFSPKVDFTTGANPNSISMGDINADGKQDMVVTNSTAASVSVLFNTTASGGASPTFAAKVDFTTGAAPGAVANADLDGDGMPDLVIANSGAASISVLRNTTSTGSGTPSYSAKVDFTTGNSPVSVSVADIDGDGIPEISAANLNSNTGSVFQLNFSALPVTITDLKAYPKNKGVAIEWISLQEINIDRYEAERSQNGQQFTKLGTAQPKTNGSLAIAYALFDPSPFTGINFYRIKIIERGQVTYSKTERVNIMDGAVNIMAVYPNPVNANNIALQLNLQKGRYIISLTDKLGQQLVSKSINHAGGSATENITSPKTLAAGVYQLRLTGGGVSITLQVIKN